MELAEGKGVAIENKQVRQLMMYCPSAPPLLSIAMITEVDTVNIPPLAADTHYTLSIEVAGGTSQEEKGSLPVRSVLLFCLPYRHLQNMDRTLEWPYSHASFISSPNPCALLVAPSGRLAHHQPPLTHFGASTHPLALGT